MKNIGLLFGTFNPIHNGHLMMANYIVNNTDIDEVWFIVNPTAPFKHHDVLLPFHKRTKMVEIACKEYHNSKLNVSTIEEELPSTYRTYDTVSALKNRLSGLAKFTIIIGEDNFKKLHKWYRAEDLILENRIFVVPRSGNRKKINSNHMDERFMENIVLFDEIPQCDLSSTFIRNEIQKGNSINYYVPSSVNEYITKNRFYR